MKKLLMAISYLSLGLLPLGAVLYYLGKVGLDAYTHFLLAGTIIWFVVTPMWMKQNPQP